MVGVGKVYDNLMIDVKATNQKLIDRSVRIIQEICAITYDEAMALYQVSEYDVKLRQLWVCVAFLRKKQQDGY